ncbi:MAG TPA: SurA N-terminal domain-containing protein [Accumulibacter sp.]|nr:SurA N-terminal domain-containing protein [Accumulibacter sp.]
MFFDSVRNNKRIVQIFLAAITLPFALWGIDSYVRDTGAGDDLAKVGDSKISLLQFEQAWRNQQERLRQTLGANYDADAMNTPEMKRAVLDALIDQRLLLLEAGKGRIEISDAQVRDVVSKIPAFQENGQFSLALFQAVLARQGRGEAQFVAQVRQDLTLQQLVLAVGETGLAGSAGTDSLLRSQTEQRQVAEARISAASFANQVNIDPAAIQKFYDDNGKSFEVPEQARAEYAILSLDSLLAQVQINDKDVAAWYEGHRERYQQNEERRASHILIVANNAAEKDKARAQAEKLLKEVQAAPAKFAELARQHSQDPGSAEKGGDLGFFGRGAMVKPFEDAAWNLRENEISALVESDFGFHIIKLTGIKPASQRALADVRSEIVDELKRQAAAKQFAEAAEAFSNMVYEQPDNLQAAAERFHLKIQPSGWIPRHPGTETIASLGPLGHPKVLAALFADDSLKNKRNTEAIEISPNTLLSARIVEHKAAIRKPFESVKAEIEALLRAQKAAALVREAGEKQLRALREGGEEKLNWQPLQTLTRQDRQKIPLPALKAVFRADSQKLPAYAGAETSNGDYALYKIVKVSHPEQAVDEAQRQALQREYGKILGQEDFAAYLASLRARYKIDINSTALTKER